MRKLVILRVIHIEFCTVKRIQKLTSCLNRVKGLRFKLRDFDAYIFVLVLKSLTIEVNLLGNHC